MKTGIGFTSRTVTSSGPDFMADSTRSSGQPGLFRSAHAESFAYRISDRMRVLGRRLRLPGWSRPLFAIPIVVLVGWWTHAAIEARIRARVADSIEAALRADRTALQFWIREKGRVAEVIASDRRVSDLTGQLLDVSRLQPGDPAALLDALPQAKLRAIITPLVAEGQDWGWAIVDPGGLILARAVDERVGERAGATIVDAVGRAVSGTVAFVPPTTRQPFGAQAQAFMLAPVSDAKGARVAALILRVPTEQIARILNVARPGETGETYAVDAQGVMLSESRFPDDVSRLGLLPPEAKGKTTAFLEVRDPGASPASAAVSGGLRRSLPLTLAAASASSGHTGSDVDGYRGYRGVLVVGAWTWLPDYGIGLVSEMSQREAYADLSVIRRAFWILIGGLALGALGIVLASGKVRRLEKEVRRTHQLGQYTLEEKIGEGGMGSVYRARHALLRRPTAIKLLRSTSDGADALARFEREVQLTSQLTHPNTVAIYDFGRTPDGVFYYAMEYLPGIPLDRLIAKDGAQPEARVVHLLKQMCASLAEAHAIGLIHRDIKPANVMLCRRGETFDVVKVLDFGLVKDVLSKNDAQLTGTQVVVGTPKFMAPEAIKAPETIDARTDVYAVAAVAFNLLTGEDVFPGKTGAEIIGHHLHTKAPLLSQRLQRPVDGFLEDLMRRCLSKVPAERPATAGALLLEIEERWKGPLWSQREAAAWWEERGDALRAAAAAASEPASRSERLSVDYKSRVKKGSSTSVSASAEVSASDASSGSISGEQTVITARDR
jgi:eukaryotic-like serine/threonine-protein kinase